MKWLNFVNKTVVLNLDKREDRLLDITDHFEKYEIPFTRVAAIENEKGADGLRDTMIKLFTESLDEGIENLLVFEDDCLIVVPPETFHDTMNKATHQLPESYHLLYLGLQATAGFQNFYSPNLLPVQKGYATHSVMYSQQGMREVLASQLQSPIDNHIVDTVQKQGHCYATYPLLCTQRAGVSDIGKSFIDWQPFIEPRFYQKINEMRAR